MGRIESAFELDAADRGSFDSRGGSIALRPEKIHSCSRIRQIRTICFYNYDCLGEKGGARHPS